MRAKIFGVLAAALLLSACGVETAVTAGAVGELETAAAAEALKQKEILMKQVEESAQALARQRDTMQEATGDAMPEYTTRNSTTLEEIQ